MYPPDVLFNVSATTRDTWRDSQLIKKKKNRKKVWKQDVYIVMVQPRKKERGIIKMGEFDRIIIDES